MKTRMLALILIICLCFGTIFTGQIVSAAKMRGDLNFDDFIRTIDECKGDVFLETVDGDVLNLKSKLCQMIGLSTILNNSEVTEATLRCTNPEDETLLFRFNLYGEVPEKE